VTDEELLQRYATGDGQALEELYLRLKADLYSYLFNQVRDRAVADDLMQDTWTKLILSTSHIDDMIADEAVDFGLRPYLYRMAKHLVVDHFRRQGWLVGLDEDEAYVDRGAPTPEGIMAVDDLFACMERRMLPLRHDHRDAFWLTRDGRLTYKEAATACGVATETIKDWVKKVLVAIRPCREEYEHDGS
jgi:RNA polymerase sigma factor (sigma-70 family)